ncbi:hypothetical protein HK102_006199 [Quaeritorhiza haematococci]|nr:hypothetical protein HK102_006199 [Quaeritorhiza haematococci]
MLIVNDFILSATILVQMNLLAINDRFAIGPLGCWVTGAFLQFTVAGAVVLLALLSLERYMLVIRLKNLDMRAWVKIMAGVVLQMHGLMDTTSASTVGLPGSLLQIALSPASTVLSQAVGVNNLNATIATTGTTESDTTKSESAPSSVSIVPLMPKAGSGAPGPATFLHGLLLPDAEKQKQDAGDEESQKRIRNLTRDEAGEPTPETKLIIRKITILTVVHLAVWSPYLLFAVLVSLGVPEESDFLSLVFGFGMFMAATVAMANPMMLIWFDSKLRVPLVQYFESLLHADDEE